MRLVIWARSIPLCRIGDLTRKPSQAYSFLRNEEQDRKRRDVFRKTSGNRWFVFRREEALWAGMAFSWHHAVQWPHLDRTGQNWEGHGWEVGGERPHGQGPGMAMRLNPGGSEKHLDERHVRNTKGIEGWSPAERASLTSRLEWRWYQWSDQSGPQGDLVWAGWALC